MNAGTMPKIIQIGAIPPPYGGVTVHLQRLLARLRSEQLDCELLDISDTPKSAPNVRSLKWRRAFMHLKGHTPAIVHFHNFAPRNLYLYSVLSTRHKTVLSFHNERFVEELKRHSSPEQALFRRLLDSLSAVVVDSEENFERARTLGLSSERIYTIPEFIPPPFPSAAEENLPVEIQELRMRHQYLVATNAYQLAFFHGEDMYGIDLIIEMAGRLVFEHELDVAVAILLPNPGNDAYLAQLRNRIGELGIAARCLLVTTPLEGTSDLWRLSDVVIRATNTDGNSVSILEALACGTPVVASDCVRRHPAVELFRNRDHDSLAATVRTVLSNLATYREQAASAELDDNAAKLIQLYRQLGAAMEAD